MNALTFIRFAIIEGLKPFFPKVELGIPDEKVQYLAQVPADYVCKGLCFQCKYNKR